MEEIILDISTHKPLFEPAPKPPGTYSNTSNIVTGHELTDIRHNIHFATEPVDLESRVIGTKTEQKLKAEPRTYYDPVAQSTFNIIGNVLQLTDESYLFKALKGQEYARANDILSQNDVQSLELCELAKKMKAESESIKCAMVQILSKEVQEKYKKLKEIVSTQIQNLTEQLKTYFVSQTPELAENTLLEEKS